MPLHRNSFEPALPRSTPGHSRPLSAPRQPVPAFCPPDQKCPPGDVLWFLNPKPIWLLCRAFLFRAVCP